MKHSEPVSPLQVPNQCPICLEIIVAEVAKWPGCNHELHSTCMKNYIDAMDASTVPKCPLCRRDFHEFVPRTPQPVVSLPLAIVPTETQPDNTRMRRTRRRESNTLRRRGARRASQGGRMLARRTSRTTTPRPTRRRTRTSASPRGVGRVRRRSACSRTRRTNASPSRRRGAF